MKVPSVRVVVVAVAAAAGVVALSLKFPRPHAAAPFAEATVATASAQPEPAPPMWHEEADTLHAGETLSGLMARTGVGSRMLVSMLGAVPTLDARRVPAGMPVVVRTRASDSLPSEIIFKLAVDRTLHVQRTDSGWTSTEVFLPWTTDTLVVEGTIGSNLYNAIDEAAPMLPAGARAELAWSLADIYEYRVDMSRDLREGDSFRVLFEREVGPGGITRIGHVLATRFMLSGDDMEAYRFATSDTHAEYYDQHGKSLRANFLRAPLQFRRISSTFGRRYHPILKRWRGHEGIDYAANSGTPIRAIGSGTVIFVGRRGGYGNSIDIRHPNGYVSRYGHMRAFARGMHRGKHVEIGQTIGYVGMTGLATGPHLHFEIRVHGVPRNPRTALKLDDGIPIPDSLRARFAAVRGTLVAALDDTARSGQRVALR